VRHQLACTYVSCKRDRPPIVGFEKIVKPDNAAASAAHTRATLILIEAGCVGTSAEQEKYSAWRELAEDYTYMGGRENALKAWRALAAAWPTIHATLLDLGE